MIGTVAPTGASSGPDVTGWAHDVDALLLAERLLAVDDEIQSLYDHVPFGSHALDKDGLFLHANALELSWLGCRRDEVVGKRKLSDFLTPDSRALLRARRFEVGPHGVIADLALDLLRRDGSTMPIALSSVGHVDESGQLIKYRAVVFDLRENLKCKTSQRIADTAFESLCGMYIADANQVIVQVNRVFTELTGYSEQEAIGQTAAQLLGSGLHDLAFYQARWLAVRTDGFWQGEITNCRKDGSLLTEWLSIKAVADEAGRVTHYVGSFFDITASRKAEADLAQLAYFDPLTNLPNRRLLLDHLTHAIAAASRSGRFGALLFIDLDYFKVINDTHGHEAGDLVLVEVARRLRGAVRVGDSVARLGGDEFVVMLENLDATAMESAVQARSVAEKILAALSASYALSGFEFHCTASIGIDLFVANVQASVLLQHADLAMYQAKGAGRNRLRFFSPNMQDQVTARAALEVDLRRALELGQFSLVYQPQVNQLGEVVAAEALLRWQHPERGMVSPAEFIVLAEQTDLIIPIGQWVLETACAQLKAWEDLPWAAHLRLAVIVSACQYRQDKFAGLVEQTLHDSGIQPAQLVLEVTESMMLDVPDAIGKMNTLKKFGVSFSMDDFGTGYSSLGSLTKLPLSELKIDQSFVRNLGVEASDAIIVQAIIAMGQALGLEVIAEGVETQEQLNLLRQHGCERYQGYLFSRPAAIDAFEALVSRSVIAAHSEARTDTSRRAAE